MRPAVCLSIAGSDSSGGAGIQADLATFAALGEQGATVITALTAQNPDRVLRIEPAAIAQIEAEMEAVFAYFEVRAVKTGMLVDAGRVGAVASGLRRWHAGKPLVVDPVMLATSGAGLLEPGAVKVLERELFPLATLITPNMPEAVRLLHNDKAGDAVEDAGTLAQRFACAVLIKGGHADDDSTLADVLCEGSGEVSVFSHPRLRHVPLHGTGCRLSAAICAKLAQGLPLQEAAGEAIGWLQDWLCVAAEDSRDR